MWYEHKKNGNKAELIEKNEKSKTVTLKLEDGTLTGPTFSTFQRWWKALESPEVVQSLMDIDNPITEEEAKKLDMVSGDEAVELAVPDPDIAGDGTPLQEVGKEIAEQAKQKAKEAKKSTGKKEKKSKMDVSKAYADVKEVLEKAGYFVKQYDKEPKIIPISTQADGKKAFCNVYIGAKKCSLCIRESEVPDGYTPDRIRKCPLGAAFDIEYGKLDTMVKIIKARKIIKKKEEK